MPLVPGKLRPNPSCRAEEDQLPGKGGGCGLNVSATTWGDLRTGQRGAKPSDFSRLQMTQMSAAVGKASCNFVPEARAWLGVPFLLGTQNELCPPERWMLWAGVPTWAHLCVQSDRISQSLPPQASSTHPPQGGEGSRFLPSVNHRPLLPWKLSFGGDPS